MDYFILWVVLWVMVLVMVWSFSFTMGSSDKGKGD